ncbi:hypothetical protein F5X96DRAFT_673373 [Biscogniauxia mediterranea]|nr:hypothetical protein F5X96DRAFT_673373 [Biscogniauxia mediterranea]
MPPTARRAHNKSRAGCTRCKSKKIKCDEKQPCTYCAKRRLPCSLQPEPEPKPKKAATRLVIRQPDAPPFCFADFGLFRHFTKELATAHADDDPSRLVWSEVVPDLATRHPFLMHELLAVAAIHRALAYPEEEDPEQQHKLAAEHQSRAIPLFRRALAASAAGEQDALPLFACACLIIPYHFAAARDAMALLRSAETGGPPEWLMLVEGCAAVTLRNAPTLMDSPLRALLGELRGPPPLEDLPRMSAADGRLVELKRRLPLAEEEGEEGEEKEEGEGKNGENGEHRRAYAVALDGLRVSFALSDQATSVLARKNAALRFPPFMGRRCKEDLAAREPAALIVVAFWCVLLHRVEERWWLRGKIRPLLAQIRDLLPPEHHGFIAWPLEQLGLSASRAEDEGGREIVIRP